MSRTTKIILGVVIGLLLLCVCVGVVAAIVLKSGGSLVEQAVSKGMSISEKPEEVAKTAQGIAEYKLPAGYKEMFGMSFFGFDMVAFGAANDKNQVIMLMQFPQSVQLSQAEMEKQMEQAFQQQTGKKGMNLKVTGQTTKNIRDQQVKLTIREGTDSDGKALRQMSGTFKGKGGLVLLMIIGTPQAWNQGAIDAFIASLR
jgi:hypothetical protein